MTSLLSKTRIFSMKRRLGFLYFILSLAFISCTNSVDVKTDDNKENVILCSLSLSYQHSKIVAPYYDSYENVSFGLDNNVDDNWTIYKQGLFTSLNGTDWVESDTSSFSFPKGTTTFYLKGIAYCINTKGQRCMAISIYKNKDRISKTSYLE